MSWFNRPKKIFDKRLGEKDKMKELTPEQIQHNWGNLRQLIDVNLQARDWKN